MGQNPNKKVQFMEVFFYTNLYALYYEISCSGFPHCNDKRTGISSKQSVYFYSIFVHVMVDSTWFILWVNCDDALFSIFRPLCKFSSQQCIHYEN